MVLPFPALRAIFALVLALAMMSACGRKPDSSTQKPGDHRAPGPGTLAGDPSLCDPATPGVEAGIVGSGSGGGSDSSDVTSTGRFALVTEGACVRVVLALNAAAGTPATHAGVARGMVLRSDGIVRIALPGGVSDVAQADTTFAGTLARAAYVVHGSGGRFFLDVHLAAPALVRVTALDSPARVLVDLEPGGGAVPNAAPSARNVVVTDPRAGAARYPLKIRGYARTFEANVVAQLSANGAVAAKTHGTAADYTLTWGEFELTLEKGPSGPHELFVGEFSAEDGSPRGVTIPLVLR